MNLKFPLARKKKGSKRKPRTKSRRLALSLAVVISTFLLLWGWTGTWFVHHPRQWLDEKSSSLPQFVTKALLYLGNPVGDLTDAFGWTGHDAVYEYDLEAPTGSILFAGAPQRTGLPAPADIRVLKRGEFLIGWSDQLQHPVWCAYHVPARTRFTDLKRPGFVKDRSVSAAPLPSAYAKSGYDRGHMVPNHAIASRFGESEQKLTFMMSNIAPQTPALNRGVWRDVEHRIADLWTARYGEIWVIVGALSSVPSALRIGPTGIDVPTAYYQLVIAQEGLDVRALAVLLPQDVKWNAWAARHIITIDELEKLTGLDFNPELPDFIQTPLEADLPTRLWPIRPLDVFKLIALRFQ